MTSTIVPLFIGTTEMILIAVVALLLFGGKKLPEIMRGLGQGISEFKKAANDVSAPMKEAAKEVDNATHEAKDSVTEDVVSPKE